MRRSVLACLSLFAAAGCAMTAPGVSRAPDQTVLIPGAIPGTTQQVVVSGEMQTTRVPVGTSTEPRHDLFIRVNGQPAVQGTLVTYGATTLRGQAGLVPVAAACQSREIGHADRQFDCLITVGAQAALPMSFRASPAGPLPPVPRL
jgi:hypothetical protein